MPTACLTSCLELTKSGRTVARLVLSKLSQCQELPEGIFFTLSSNQTLTFVTLCQSCREPLKTCHCFFFCLFFWILSWVCCLYVRRLPLPSWFPGRLAWSAALTSAHPPLLPHPLAVSPPVCEGGVWAKEEAGHVSWGCGSRAQGRRERTRTHAFTLPRTHTRTHTLSQRKWNKCWLHSAVSSLTHCCPLAGMPQRKRSFTFGAYGG